jgi:hypothetical protein
MGPNATPGNGSGYGGNSPNGGPSERAQGGAGGGVAGGGGSTIGSAGTSVAAMSDPNATPDASGNPQAVSVMMGSPPSDTSPNSTFDANEPRDQNRSLPPEQRGNDWALRQKPQRAVPIRRTIRVVVRENQLAILPNSPLNGQGAAAGKVVPMRGDTVLAVDDFVEQVRDQIDAWGIAGNGLYWRPVIVLTVGPDGQRRAADLARLLRNSGLEIRTDETANNAPQGNTHETR